MPAACFLGRGRFPWLSDASHRDVDESQFTPLPPSRKRKDIHSDVLLFLMVSSPIKCAN